MDLELPIFIPAPMFRVVPTIETPEVAEMQLQADEFDALFGEVVAKAAPS